MWFVGADQQYPLRLRDEAERVEIGDALWRLDDEIADALRRGEPAHAIVGVPGAIVAGADELQPQALRQARLGAPEVGERREQRADQPAPSGAGRRRYN